MAQTNRWFLAALALAWSCASGRVEAEEAKPKPLDVLSILPIVLDTADPSRSVQDTSIRLRLGSGTPPTSLEVVEAKLDKRSTNFARAFTFGQAQGTAPDLTVPLRIELARLPFAGAYIVKVRAVRPAAAQAEVPVELELKFERMAAQLAPIDELSLERNPVTGTVVPEQLYLTEQSNLAFVRFAFPLVSGQLRGPTGEILPADLLLEASGAVQSGQRLSVRPVVNGSLPLGTSTGTIRLDSPQLATAVDVKFKIVNRLGIVFLPISIVIFICLGLLYRKLLADRQALDEGLLEAQRSYARLKDLADTQAEPELRNRIGAIIAALAAAIERAESAEALRTAATAAGTAVDEILKAAAQSRSALRTRIDALKTALGRPQGHSTEIVTIIAEANTRLADFLRGLDRGLAQSLEPRIEGLENDLKDKLPAVLGRLATEIKYDLEEIGPWPGTGIATAVGNLTPIVSEAEQVPAGNIAQAVQASLNLTRAARRFFTETVRVEVGKVVGDVVNALSPEGNEPELAAVKKLQAQIGDFGPMVQREPPYHELSGLVRELRHALARLVRAKAPAGAKEVEAALGKDEFVAAAKAAKAAQPPKPKVEAYGPGRPGEGRTMGSFTAATVAVLADAPAPAPTLQISAPAQVQVGQTVRLEALIQPPIDNAAASWTVVTGMVGQDARDGMHFTFIPHASGTVIVRCDVSDPRSQRTLSVEASISVTQSAAELAAIATRQRMGRREVAMSAITGLFIAGAGTMIFAETFVGSWRDFLFAAIWGFTADVGTGRLRALAEPLISRQIPGLPAQRGAAPAAGGAGN